MRAAYARLAALGYAHSVEAWQGDALVGGLYGIAIGRMFFGESMFAAHSAFIETGRLADVGSGAGFPGLALKLLAPDLEVFLIESVMKKAAS